MNWLSRATLASKNLARNIHASGPCWQTGQEAETVARALATVSRVAAGIDAICSPTFAHFATRASAGHSPFCATPWHSAFAWPVHFPSSWIAAKVKPRVGTSRPPASQNFVIECSLFFLWGLVPVPPDGPRERHDLAGRPERVRGGLYGKASGMNQGDSGSGPPCLTIP